MLNKKTLYKMNIYIKKMLEMFDDAFGDKFKKSLALTKIVLKNSIYSILMTKFLQDLKIVPSIHYVYNNIKNNQNYELFYSKSCWELIHDDTSQYAEVETFLNKFGISVKSSDRKMFLNSLRTFDKIDIVVCGSSKTGKTTSIDILNGKNKEDKITPTTNIENRKVSFNMAQLRYLTISLWDTPYIELNDKVIHNIIKECDAIVYMIDSSRLAKKLEKDLNEKIQFCGANKTSSEQVISKEEGTNFSQERGIHFVEMNLKK